MKVSAAAALIAAGMFCSVAQAQPPAAAPAGAPAAAPATASGKPCEDATMVAIPDGATATEEQIRVARQQVRAYLEAMETYLVCLQDQLDAKGDKATPEYKSQMSTRIIAGDDERQSVVAAINKASADYRAAHPSN